MAVVDPPKAGVTGSNPVGGATSDQRKRDGPHGPACALVCSCGLQFAPRIIIMLPRMIIMFQSSSTQNTSSRNLAASSGDGGSGFGLLPRPLRGRAVWDSSHSHRTVAENAPLTIEWICRTVETAIGVHACGRHVTAAQSCSPPVLCSTAAPS